MEHVIMSFRCECDHRARPSALVTQASSRKPSNPRFAPPRTARFTKIILESKQEKGNMNFGSKGGDTSNWPGPGSYNW